MIHIDRLLGALRLTAFDHDAFELMERSLATVSHQTHRYFGEVKQHETVVPGDRKTIWLPETPIITNVFPLEIASGYGDTWTDIEATAYSVSGRKLTYLSGDWPYATEGYPYENIRVRWYFGYPVGELPGDIEQWILELTARDWLNRGKENLKSEKFGDAYSYTLGGGGSSTTSDDGRTGSQRATRDYWKPPVIA